MKIKLFDSEVKAKEVLVENQPRLIRAEGKEFCIVRTSENINVFENLCPHMGERLHRGNTNYVNEIVCPLHTYRFNMTTGEEAENRCSPLSVYEVQSENDGIYLIL